MHTFTFCYAAPDGQMTVDLASWEILHLASELEELRIHTRRNAIHLIIGSGLLGMFVYIPDCGRGFTTNDLKDTEYSNTHLAGMLDCEDAAALSYALSDYTSC